MKSPSQITHEAHGSTAVDGCDLANGACYVCCGSVARGTLVQKWMGSNYTDQNRVAFPAGTHVCEACCYVHSRTSPVLGRAAKEGKKFGGNFRNYSHVYDERGYANASKGEKPLIREFLARHHQGVWFAAIADSGQKHVLPFAPLNGPGRAGAVIFEEAIVMVPDDQSLLADMITLLSAGVTKDEIGSGNWYVRTMIENRELVREFEAKHGPFRGGEWFSLAIWLAQRDEEKFATVEAARKEKANAKRQTKNPVRNADGGDVARNKKLVPKRAKRAPGNELLGADPKPMQSSGETVNERQRVGERSSTKDGDPGLAQIGFPGIG